MEIKPGLGLDNILFGVTKQELMDILGEPDEVRLEEEDEELEEVLRYNKLKTCFSFDFENDDDDEKRLSWIESENPSLTIFNGTVIGQSEEDITELLSSNKIDDSYVEEDLYIDTLYSDDDNLEFEMLYGKVARVMFGPFYDENDSVVWPN